MADKDFTLNTGAKIPAFGLGTWQGDKGVIKEAVLTAIKSGYRLIDGAYVYGNEEEVGQGIREAISSGIVKREDLFVVSKCWATYTTRCELGLDKSLQLLGLDYVDLYLVHWPILMNPEGNDEKFPKHADGSRDIIRTHNHVDTWKLMEKLPATGKTKAVGVSNYSKAWLEQLLPHATTVPAVNQVENHPQLPQQELVDFCKEKSIHIMAYSPLGSTGGPLLTAEPVVKIAEKHNISPAAVLLGYQIARGVTVIPKSVNPDRIKANAQLKDLDADDMKVLNDYSEQLAKDGKLNRYVFPPFGTDFGFPDKVGQ